MVETKTFSKFGFWFPLVGVLAVTLLEAIVFVLGYVFLKWSINLESAAILSIVWYISLGLWGLLGWKLSKTKIKEVFTLQNITIKKLLNTAGIAVLAQGLFIGITFLLSDVLNQNIKGNADNIINSEMSNVAVITTIIITVVFAPIFEEILFRGLFFDGFYNTSKKLKASNKVALALTVALTSIIFGLAHVTSLDLNAVFIVFATGSFGAYLAYLRIKTKSITLGIIAHAIFNSLTIILMLFSL